jgi:hypothetical protein
VKALSGRAVDTGIEIVVVNAGRLRWPKLYAPGRLLLLGLCFKSLHELAKRFIIGDSDGERQWCWAHRS